MSGQMYKDFSISTVPEAKQVEDCGRIRTRIEITISITERSTGNVFNYVTPCKVSERGIENIILKNFPDSTTAVGLRSERNFDKVTLIANLSTDSVCGNMHTALRKLCDSKASIYWWNLIHILPEGIMGYVWEETSRDLMLMTKTAKLCDYAKVIHTAWINAFERLYHAARQWEQNKRIYADEVTPDPKKFEYIFEEMSNKEFKAYLQAVQMANLAVDYLSADDWAGMMGFMYETEYSPAETV